MNKRYKPDRRRYTRVEKEMPIFHRLYLRGNCRYLLSWNCAQAKNISAGGLLFESNIHYKKRDVIELKIGLPYFSELFNFYAQVSREDQIDESFTFSTAAGFLTMNEATQDKVNNIILSNDFTAGMPVMLVHQNMDESIMIKKFLEKTGYRVSVAMNGEEAKEKFKEDHPKVTVIIDDDGRINAKRLCQEIRTIEKCQTNILIVSAKNSSNDIVKGLDGGATGYIVRKERMSHIAKAFWAHVGHHE